MEKFYTVIRKYPRNVHTHKEKKREGNQSKKKKKNQDESSDGENVEEGIKHIENK